MVHTLAWNTCQAAGIALSAPCFTTCMKAGRPGTQRQSSWGSKRAADTRSQYSCPINFMSQLLELNLLTCGLCWAGGLPWQALLGRVCRDPGKVQRGHHPRQRLWPCRGGLCARQRLRPQVYPTSFLSSSHPHTRVLASMRILRSSGTCHATAWRPPQVQRTACVSAQAWAGKGVCVLSKLCACQQQSTVLVCAPCCTTGLACGCHSLLAGCRHSLAAPTAAAGLQGLFDCLDKPGQGCKLSI